MKSITENPYRLLGVYANGTLKERVSNANKLKAYLKVNRQLSFPLDLTQYMPPLERSVEMLADADGRLTLPRERLKHAQFWFVKATTIDGVAFNHLLAGNMDKAIEVWNKKLTVSSAQDLIVCYLLREDYANAIEKATLLYGQHDDEDIAKILTGEENIPLSRPLYQDFLDVLHEEVGTDSLLRCFETVSAVEWREYLTKTVVAPIIGKIQAAITSAKGRKGKGPAECLAAGEKLMSTTKPLLAQLQKLLPKTDLQYQMIADKLGLEVLQCGIDYYNGSDEPDAAHKAMKLQEYALQIVVGKMAKDRCQENVDILRRIIAELPPMEVMAEHKAIMSALKTFATKPDLIKYSIQLIKDCAPYIVAIKEKLGKSHRYYLKISTTIVSNALGNVISEVNEALKKKDFEVLKSTLISAWRVQLYMDKFDLEPEFKKGRFEKSRSVLYGIIKPCMEFESSIYSPLYRYGCGWCNDLDVSDVELRTDDEFFASCKTLASYREYLEKFPDGKHVSEAKLKIEELRFHECKTMSDYQKFINDYPGSVYRKEAKTSLERLRREEEKRRKKKARQEAEIAACDSMDDILTLYANQEEEGIDANICSGRAFELAKTKRDFKKVLLTFGENSTGGRKAKERIEDIAERRKKIIKWACWIGIPILILIAIFLIWDIRGFAMACAIIAGLAGLVAWGL